MKTMLVKATSTNHGNKSQLFRVPAEPGRYPRRCPNACDDKKDRRTGLQIHCGCGFPVARTDWEAPEGYVVSAEWTDSWDGAGKNNIVIVVDYDID